MVCLEESRRNDIKTDNPSLPPLRVRGGEEELSGNLNFELGPASYDP
jgi:hypothetical protein